MFGGTVGGPLVKNRTFFFVDYQGTRQTRAPLVNATMPSISNFGGDFTDSAGSITNSVGGPGFADVLNTRMGLPPGTIVDAEPYYFSGCTTQSQCVFPGAIIPQSAWSPVATAVVNLCFIPQPNNGSTFTSSAFARTLRDDKGGIRIDQNTRFGNFFGYYFNDDYSLNDPIPNGGATVPAANFPYNALTTGRAQLINLGHTKNFGYY